MKISGIDAYKVFQAIKLHFTRKSFDYFRSGGKVKISDDAFNARRDKFAFHRLAKNYDHDQFVQLVLANVLKKHSLYSLSLLEPEAEDSLIEYQKRIQSLSYIFKQDLERILSWSYENNVSVDTVLNPGDSYPPLAKMVMRKEICFETLVILNGVLNFFPMWNRRVKDEIIWPEFAFKCEKYSPFVLSKVDLMSMKKIIKNELCS